RARSDARVDRRCDRLGEPVGVAAAGLGAGAVEAAPGDGGELCCGTGTGEGGRAGDPPGTGFRAHLSEAGARRGHPMNETTSQEFQTAFAVPPMPEQERMVEAVLFASYEPMTALAIAERLP